MRRTIWLLLGVAAVLAASLWILRSGGSSSDPNGSGFNVLLISIDTTRADHLGCYGHSTIKTPNIDRIAREGVQFLNCSASVPLTLPSHSSMLTGLYPFVHGARDNGSFRLHDGNVTLTEVLRDEGYATSAEVAAYVLNTEFGLNQGFEVYHDVTSVSQFGSATHTPDAATSGERTAQDIADATIAALQSRADKPFFHFVHFFDPHFIYQPPERFAKQYADPYLGEIAYVDEQLGRILDALADLGLERRTLVVLTADHGEGRSEHDEVTHGSFLFDSTLRVPLIFRCPGTIAPHPPIEAQVRTIDIPSTVLAFLGLPDLPDAQGTSLLPLVTGREHDLGLDAYAEAMVSMYNFGYSPLRSLRRADWKYIHAPTPRLYDLAHDLGERTNVAEAHPDRVTEMRDTIQRIIAEAPTIADPGVGRRTISDEDMKKLADLGYIHASDSAADGRSELDLFTPRGPDPHDHIEVIQLTTEAMISMRLERFEEAEERIRALLAKQDPDAEFHWAYKTLGYLLSRRGQQEEAIQYYLKALKLIPADSMTLTHLAVSLALTGKTEEAVTVFESALDMKPTFAHTHENYAVALHELGRLDEAEVQCRTALELEPEYTNARILLVRMLLDAGRFAEAEAEIKTGLAIVPNAGMLRSLLETVSTKRKQLEQLKAPFQAQLEADPHQAQPHVKLAEICLRANQLEQSEAHLRAALDIDPNVAKAWETLAFVMLRRAAPAEAAQAFQSGLDAEPASIDLANDLAWLLATTSDDSVRDGEKALRLAEQARDRSDAPNPNILATISAALAELGRFDHAVATLETAITLATEAGNASLAKKLRDRQAEYRDGRPTRM